VTSVGVIFNQSGVKPPQSPPPDKSNAGHLFFKEHKNKIPTAMPMFSGMTISMAIIFISPGVAVKPEINMADKSGSFSSANVAHIPAM